MGQKGRKGRKAQAVSSNILGVPWCNEAHFVVGVCGGRAIRNAAGRVPQDAFPGFAFVPHAEYLIIGSNFCQVWAWGNSEFGGRDKIPHACGRTALLRRRRIGAERQLYATNSEIPWRL